MTHLSRLTYFAAGLSVLIAGCGGGGGGAPTESSTAAKSATPAAIRVPALAMTEDDSLPSQSANPAQAETSRGKANFAARSLYVVQLDDEPAAVYTGSVSGYAATKPGQGQKINPNSPEVTRYVGYLNGKHDAVLAAAGGGRKAHSYSYVFNGFAAELTETQVEALAKTPGVLSVAKNEMRRLDTSTTPGFLELNAANGLWNRLGGAFVDKGPNSRGAGEGIVIGIVDGGIWPEHPSFSDRDASGKLVYQQLPGWHGKCQPGEAFTGSDCNQKLIGARYYNEGFGGNAGIDADLPFEFNSPRDYGGHGTHTASTAGGNLNVATTGQAAVLGAINGIAPRARIAAYKVCWQTPEGGSCASVDSIAAIDQAVADGVDVINFSISGSRTNFRDGVEIAFLNAASAGVFVAASAGNSGPTISTVVHPGPWLTTVAAGTHPRAGEGPLTLGNGATYSGASFVSTPLPGPLVDSANVGLASAPAGAAELCFPGSLDAAKVAGKIVLCKRGANALVEKSGTVATAGGIGAIIYNDPLGTATNTLSIFHSIPTVHVTAATGVAVKAYIASAGAAATAVIGTASIVNNVPAPATASFSSRGPLLAGGGDLLKPDLIAPGNEIIAAVAPPGNGGASFAVYSGTSMSSPHVAGLAALLKQLHPSWSPMAIKSALMTSAYDIIDGPNTNPLVIFRQGAGHVRPNSAADPGLVYDSGFADWLGFLCGTQLPTSFCANAGVPVLDPSNFNGASIAIGDLAGTQTITRRVTNVSGKKLSVSSAVSGLIGVTAEVSPANLTLNPGATASFTVKFSTTTAAPNAYRGGYLTWTGDGYSVRSPIVIRPLALSAPAQVDSSYAVTFGYAGPFSATARGLIPAAVTAGSVTQDPDQTFDPTSTVGTVSYSVTVPADTSYARFSLFEADVSAGTDIDVYVFGPTGALVAASTNGGSAEEANVVNPAAGVYTVFLHGWGVVGANSPFKLHTWVLGTADAGNMVVTAPTVAAVGASGTVNLSFSALAAGVKYLGSVAYSGVTGLPNPTIVRVDGP